MADLGYRQGFSWRDLTLAELMVLEQRIQVLGKMVLRCHHEMEQETLQQVHRASSLYAIGCLAQQQLEHALG